MSRLSDELEWHYEYLRGVGKGDRLNKVLTEYNVIQKMIGHGTCLKFDQEDKDESSQNDTNEDGSDDDTSFGDSNN